MVDFLIGSGIIIAFLLLVWYGGFGKSSTPESLVKLEKEDLDAVGWDDNKQHTEQGIH
jgi:hypothetical protein